LTISFGLGLDFIFRQQFVRLCARWRRAGRVLDIVCIPSEMATKANDVAGNVIETHEHKGRFKDW